MPPELQGNVLLLKTGAVRIGGRAPTLKPFKVSDLRMGPTSGAGFSAGLNLDPFRVAFGYEVLAVEQEFSFQLEREERPETRIVAVRCRWGTASSAANLSAKSTGFAMKVPQGNVTLCELVDEPEGEPWRLFLWVGPPTKLVPPEFPSGGGLVRGDVRYEASSTNAIQPSLAGLNPGTITGTFFRREGRTVAAVDRLLPLRILMQCSVPPGEQAILAAVGAALYVRDSAAMTYER